MSEPGMHVTDGHPVCEHGSLRRKCDLCQWRTDRDALASLLLHVPSAVQSKQAYEDWWRDVVDELVAQGIAVPKVKP